MGGRKNEDDEETTKLIRDKYQSIDFSR
jgi:hypothetical protein